MKSFVAFHLTKHYSGYQIKIGMGGAYGMYGQRSGAYRVLVRKLEGNSPLIKPKRKGSIKLKWIFKNWNWCVERISVTQDRDWRWPPVNVVMNLRVP
jgi:hypothetical protein